MNVYELVTERIVEQMQKGIIPWNRPWHGGDDGAINYESRKPYSLVNQMLLGRAGEWLTFNQITSRGGSIKKGAESGIVVFFTTAVKKAEKKEGEELTEEDKKKERRYPLLRYYRVFHIDDCEGIQTKCSTQETKTIEPIAEAERVISEYAERTDLNIVVSLSNRAYYSPGQDKVVVPKLEQYDAPEHYYSTLFHECVHSTGSSKRLNRSTITEVNHFGDEDYSREELIAEMGSAMLCNRLGIETEPVFRNSVAYLQGWLTALKNDKYMVVWAASRAERAAKLIMNEGTVEELKSQFA